MRGHLVETVLGAVVLAVAAAFLVWAYGRSDVASPDGYVLRAVFDRADGLDPGADVRVAGIRVGTVLATRLDPETWQAVVEFSVREDIRLPVDSSAAIVSTGLLGRRYLAITPGAEEETLAPGEAITFTQPALNLEELIGRFVFGGPGGGDGR